MKCLILHCKKFSYRLDHETPVADKNVEHQSAEFSNALVIFLAIEKEDSQEKVSQAAKEIKSIDSKINPDSIVINPFAHLSKNLAGPGLARELSQSLVKEIGSKIDQKVIYTSFGWYKSFMVDVYGHDNSQIFRDF